MRYGFSAKLFDKVVLLEGRETQAADLWRGRTCAIDRDSDDWRFCDTAASLAPCEREAACDVGLRTIPT